MKTALFVVGSFRAKSFNRQLPLDEIGRAALAAQAAAFADFLES